MDGLKKFNEFVLLHRPQLLSSGVPQHLWECLHRKLCSEIFDAGDVFQLAIIDYENEENEEKEEEEVNGSVDPPGFALLVTRDNGIQSNDPTAIFLIDHAWTFRINDTRRELQQMPRLAQRMARMMGVDDNDPQLIDRILNVMWKYCHAYSIVDNNQTEEQRIALWYIMDEVGSAINHCDDEANFRVIPFLYLNTRTAYSLLFPVRDCVRGERVTRDIVEFVGKNAPERAALLLPWINADLRDESFDQIEPTEEYFTSGHIPETLPQEDAIQPCVSRDRPLRVYSEYEILSEHLTSSQFQLVDSEEEADVLWLTKHFKDFARLSDDTPNKFINQFPCEYIITVKDLLSIVCRRAANVHHDSDTLATQPAWLPTTYNLKTELVQFASYYQHRSVKGLDNHWIIKPWNLARGLDTYISADIKQIMRLPTTGPKIAQKYIEKPVLFQRQDTQTKVKFDVRYVVLLKSVQPLEIYVHRKFFLRFAEEAFSLDHLDDYRKHFTVMNYHDGAAIHHVPCDDFLNYWHQQYPNYPWCAIEDAICESLRKMFVCATRTKPPCSIGHNAQSRALYAADIMLQWADNDVARMQHQLLEINWTPDCQRACQYYPDFFNDIFKLLFLDIENDEIFKKLESEKTTADLR